MARMGQPARMARMAWTGQRALPVRPETTGSTGSAGAAGRGRTSRGRWRSGFSRADRTVGPGAAGTPTSLSRFAAVTTANTTAQALSATYANILEFATTDIFANVGGFTVATASNISTVNRSK